jgi:hypothetical protein
VTYAVIHGSPSCPIAANVDSLGQAARLAVQHLKDGRQNVRVRLPGGEVLAFEAFQDAVFAGKLKDERPAGSAPAEPRPRAAAPTQLWSVIPPI